MSNSHLVINVLSHLCGAKVLSVSLQESADSPSQSLVPQVSWESEEWEAKGKEG